MLALAGTSYSQGAIRLTWEVVKYDITATLPSDYSADRDLDVTAALAIKNISSSSFSRLTLRISDQAQVSSVTANGSNADFSNSPESTGGAKPLQRVVVSLPAVAAGQTTNVSVRYKLAVKENDGLASLSEAGSQFLPFSFWYPTPTSWFFTGGADFAPVRITVNGADGQSVFSAGSGTANTFDLPLNGQPFFVAGTYENTVVEGVEVAYPKRGSAGARPERVETLASIAKKADAFLSQRLGKSLGVPIRIICVKRGAGFSDSGTVLVDEAVLSRAQIDSSTVQNLAEGLAKSYLGNVIAVNDDGYGVIREGLSRFLANEFIETEYGEAVADVERLRQRTSYSAISDRDAPLNVVTPADGYYYTSTANKGSLIWGYLARSAGENFYSILKNESEDNSLTLPEVRSAFSNQKAYLDYTIDRVTEMNLMIGLPQKAGGSTKSALRNLGDIDANVVVTATTKAGNKIRTNVTVRAKNFGEAVFQTVEEIVRVEVDEHKSYPQTNYSDDVAPRIADEPDPVLFVKREFDRQKYSEAETNALAVLGRYPEFHDVRVLLARSQLAAGKVTDARSNFEKVLGSALPSAQSIAWSELGLGEIAKRTGQTAEAASRFRAAILADAEYGATLGALRGIVDSGGGSAGEDVKAFFSTFDKAVISNSKAQVDVLLAGGEVSRFSASVTGSAQQWVTDVRFAYDVDGVDTVVGAEVQLKLLNRDEESGVALFRISRTPSGLKLTSVDILEVG
ncbi:MAG: hypothetical protein DWQ47_17695 [Acidobacteria bacterium]|nr:MAG: hypothetical protein DWQ32_05095 [Acidobacteriota bacterium]REK02128.1 MAG: hypothetical protein DWQ38_07060 [Acidobacteriota bacterium]REK14070.1 MAG: hypothetical protein DWQ43_10785 [Acidobacteriota bacterium]REK42065.1 MAG: hypothetical protein DWQ47_17695 [Acidobacteriota bacterium]